MPGRLRKILLSALGVATLLGPVPAGAAELRFAYNVAFDGAYKQLETRLRDVSALVAKKGEPPATLQGLRRRAEGDKDVFLKLLRSRGFYDARVDWDVDTSKTPVEVLVRVDLGVRYKILRFDVEGLPEPVADLGRGPGLEALGIELGRPAVAEFVLEAEKKLLFQLIARGYPFARVADRRIVVDHGSHTMEATFVIDTGPPARFGDVTVKGPTDIEPGYVERRLAFARGDRFDPVRIDKSRKALLESGVFSSVVFSWGEVANVGPDGLLPITVTVVEGKRHSVGAGLKYSSADGFGGDAFWENRNLLGGAEKLRGELEITQVESTGAVSFHDPDFVRDNLGLLLRAALEAEDTDAYDRRAFVLSGGLERRFSEAVLGTAGAAFEEEIVRGADHDEDRYTLVGIPLGLRYDSSDNPLDPTRGQRSSIGLTPYISVAGTQVQMFALKGSESFYVALTRSRRQVWATRFSFGSILGDKGEDIPDDKRLYAGGGDSVRGYKYQFVGPLDAHNNPLGGRSLLQAGTELRFKVWDNFGVVPFVEGAGVYGSTYPDFSENFQWAAGLGLRYFTVAGPIRLDVGFPLNGRPVDNIFEIYISLGQAF